MNYDAIIVGAGPGGATTAAFMAQNGMRVLLIDKERFPRDKVCGDAISGKSIDVLRQLDIIPHLMTSDSQGSWGITFGAPSGDTVAIPFTSTYDPAAPPTFVCPRKIFDCLLFERAIAAGADIREETIYEGITNFHERHFMEIHFIDSYTPGYFWIFPQPFCMASSKT